MLLLRLDVRQRGQVVGRHVPGGKCGAQAVHRPLQHWQVIANQEISERLIDNRIERDEAAEKLAPNHLPVGEL